MLKKRTTTLLVALMMLAAMGFAYSVSAETSVDTQSQTQPVVGTNTGTGTATGTTTTGVDGTTEEPTTTTAPTTVDWALISPTDEHGNTLFPPPPTWVETTTTTTTTTSTTTRSTASTRRQSTIGHNPAHPEDRYTGALPWRPPPTWHRHIDGGYTLYPQDEEWTAEDEYDPYLGAFPDGHTEDDSWFEDILSPEWEGDEGKRALNWPVIIIAASVFFMAGSGVAVMLIKKKP